MTPAEPQAGRAGASAALLDRISQDALDPTYLDRARDGNEHPRRTPRGSSGLLLTFAVLALAGLLIGILVAVARQRASAADSERGSLVALAEQARAGTSALEERVVTLDAEVTRLREATLAAETVGSEQAARIRTLGVAAGTEPVEGPGARVVVSDGEADATGPAPSLSRVLDIDLQQVVNGLWESGAESVAINGQRVGALTAIRSVQDVVLVNYVPVVSPYEVVAIGDARTLPTDFLRSSGGRWLQAVNLSSGIGFSIDSMSSPSVLPAQPAGQLRHARPVAVDEPEDGR